MRIQAFIPDWPGEKQHAAETAALLAPHCESVTILDNPDHYFTEQFNEMLGKFSGDIMFWVMADVWPPEQLAQMVDKAKRLMSENVGIYAPDIDWNGHKYFKDRLAQIEPGVYSVPAPEMLCWMISKDVLQSMPVVNPQINKLGWGIEYVAVATARHLGKIAVRDYNFTAKHPRGANYNNPEATKQFERMMSVLSLGSDLNVNDIYEERQRVAARVTVSVIGSGTTLNNAVAYCLNYSRQDIVLQYPYPSRSWIDMTHDSQDVYYLEEGCPDELIEACKANHVTNLWFLIPREGRTGPDIWYWRHPKYEVNLTTHMGLQVGWLLPGELKLKEWELYR